MSCEVAIPVYARTELFRSYVPAGSMDVATDMVDLTLVSPNSWRLVRFPQG